MSSAASVPPSSGNPFARSASRRSVGPPARPAPIHAAHEKEQVLLAALETPRTVSGLPRTPVDLAVPDAVDLVLMSPGRTLVAWVTAYAVSPRRDASPVRLRIRGDLVHAPKSRCVRHSHLLLGRTENSGHCYASLPHNISRMSPGRRCAPMVRALTRRYSRIRG